MSVVEREIAEGGDGAEQASARWRDEVGLREVVQLSARMGEVRIVTAVWLGCVCLIHLMGDDGDKCRLYHVEVEVDDTRYKASMVLSAFSNHPHPAPDSRFRPVPS